MIELINIDDGWYFITEYRGIANIVGKYGAIATHSKPAALHRYHIRLIDIFSCIGCNDRSRINRDFVF